MGSRKHLALIRLRRRPRALPEEASLRQMFSRLASPGPAKFKERSREGEEIEGSPASPDVARDTCAKTDEPGEVKPAYRQAGVKANVVSRNILTKPGHLKSGKIYFLYQDIHETIGRKKAGGKCRTRKYH